MGTRENEVQSSENYAIGGKIPSSVSFQKLFQVFYINFKICFGKTFRRVAQVSIQHK